MFFVVVDLCSLSCSNLQYPPSRFDAEPVVYSDAYRKPYNTYTVVGYAT